MENLNSLIQGDSGSHMQIGEGQHWTQIGIVSWGIGCGKSFYPGVYTRVNKVRDWIDRIVTIKPISPSLNFMAKLPQSSIPTDVWLNTSNSNNQNFIVRSGKEHIFFLNRQNTIK